MVSRGMESNNNTMKAQGNTFCATIDDPLIANNNSVKNHLQLTLVHRAMRAMTRRTRIRDIMVQLIVEELQNKYCLLIDGSPASSKWYTICSSVHRTQHCSLTGCYCRTQRSRPKIPDALRTFDGCTTTVMVPVVCTVVCTCSTSVTQVTVLVP